MRWVRDVGLPSLRWRDGEKMQPLPAQDCTALCYCFRLKSGKASKAAKRLGDFLQTE